MSNIEPKESTATNGRPRIGADAVVALLLALTNLAVLFSCWRTIGIQADESMNIYGALRMLEGERIYRDFWVYHTPGIFFLTAAVFSILGKSIFAIRITLILAASVTASGLYLLGRKFMGRLPSTLASMLFVMVGVNLWPIAGYHWYSTLTLVFCAFLVARFLEDRSRRKSLFSGGLLAGATFLFQQPKGGYLICLMSVFLIADELLQNSESPRLARALRTASIFAAGVFGPLVAAAAYFAWVGTLDEAVSATIIYPIRLLAQASGEAGYGGFYGSLTERVLADMAGAAPLPGSGAWVALVSALLIKYAAPLSIFAAAGIWGVRRLRKKEENSMPVLCSTVGLAAFGSALQRPDFHHLLTIMAPCYLTFAYVLHSLAPQASGQRLAPARKAAALAIGAVFTLSCARILVGELVYASDLRTVSVGSPLGFVPVPKDKVDVTAFEHPIMNVIDFIQLSTMPSDTIFVMSFSPFIYYLTERENPTPYLDIPSSPCAEGAKFHVFKLGHASFNMKHLENAARMLDEDKTPLVVLDPAAACQVRDGWEEAGFESDPLIDYVKRHYSIRLDNGVFVVMTRDDSGVPSAAAAPRTGQPPPPRSR